MRSFRTYSELVKMENFEDRFDYLRLDGRVCEETFGFDRIFNQMFYRSPEWKIARDKVIIRDMGCDLGHKDHPINDIFVNGKLYKAKFIVHHMNPWLMEDLKNKPDILLNPEYLITTVLDTHNAIHYGNENLLPKIIERSPNDTCPWRSK